MKFLFVAATVLLLSACHSGHDHKGDSHKHKDGDGHDHKGHSHEHHAGDGHDHSDTSQETFTVKPDSLKVKSSSPK